MKRRIVFCLAVLFGMLACSEEENVPTGGWGLDGKLVGYWYRLDTLSYLSRTGQLFHHAFYITPDGLYHQAGVETATGKIDLLPQSWWVRINFAYAGRIGLDWFAPPGGEADTVDYIVDWNRLSVSGSSPISGIWTRKQPKEKVTEPLDVRFTLQIDGVETSIPGIAPDAGAGIRPTMTFWMSADLEYGHRPRGVDIEVPCFNGPGTYVLGWGDGLYNIMDGDLVTTYHTDSLYTGSITIDTYDLQAKRCSGSFEFSMRMYQDRNIPPKLCRFTKGRFSVPIF